MSRSCRFRPDCGGRSWTERDRFPTSPVHTFPAGSPASRVFATAGDTKIDSLAPDTAAYRRLEAGGIDPCGIVRLAETAVGAPFVGAVASALVLAELLKVMHGGRRLEVINMDLRAPARRTAAGVDGYPVSLIGVDVSYTRRWIQ